MSYQTTNLKKKLEFLIYKEKIQKMIFVKKKVLGYQAIPKLQPKYEFSRPYDKNCGVQRLDRRTDRQTDRRTES